MDLYINGGNIRLGNCRRFTSLTMYNLHIFYLAPLMFSRSIHFLISGLHAGNTKIKGQPHWVVLLDLCQLSCLSFTNKLYHWQRLTHKEVEVARIKLGGILCTQSKFNTLQIMNNTIWSGLRWDERYLTERERGTAWLFPSMHDYCFLPCMWSEVIDLFPSKQTGIVGMAVYFSIARGIAWPKGRSLA